jgi:pimeloyl-ACP methyl ester carboxylesterase
MAPMTSAPWIPGVLCCLIVTTLGSPRPPATGVADLASDLVAVMEAAGFERFSVLGYSFTGAFAPWLTKLPPDLLVSKLPCPLFAFWGEDDEGIARGGGVRLLAAGLDRHGFKHASFPGHDHEGMLAHINEAVPSVPAWFDGLPRAE